MSLRNCLRCGRANITKGARVCTMCGGKLTKSTKPALPPTVATQVAELVGSLEPAARVAVLQRLKVQYPAAWNLAMGKPWIAPT